MSRKPPKGYYVKGQFVAQGSELDQELQAERGAGESKTARKREMSALQDLGAALLDLGDQALARIDLPEGLLDALEQARRTPSFEGKRRQMQYVGKLMRRLDARQLQDAREAVQAHTAGTARQTALLHQCEQWRDLLVHEPQALAQWLEQFPATDGQQLRALVRQARKDEAQGSEAAGQQPAPPAPRRGRSWRALYQMLHAELLRAGGDPPSLPPAG